ncbi:hypothetical protein TNCV_446661 [Trichonephila clavipes]|nr:hypothetical protein TNCV_446661 [Trichonephila clavipes]
MMILVLFSGDFQYTKYQWLAREEAEKKDEPINVSGMTARFQASCSITVNLQTFGGNGHHEKARNKDTISFNGGVTLTALGDL